MRGTVQPGHHIFHYNAAQPLSQVARLSNYWTNFPDSEWPIDLLVRRHATELYLIDSYASEAAFRAVVWRKKAA